MIYIFRVEYFLLSIIYFEQFNFAHIAIAHRSTGSSSSYYAVNRMSKDLDLNSFGSNPLTTNEPFQIPWKTMQYLSGCRYQNNWHTTSATSLPHPYVDAKAAEEDNEYNRCIRFPVHWVDRLRRSTQTGSGGEKQQLLLFLYSWNTRMVGDYTCKH